MSAANAATADAEPNRYPNPGDPDADPGNAHAHSVTPTPIPTATPLGTASTTTGVNPWWTYEEGAIPGIGKWMVNVASGNLLVQAEDLDIPERGVDLAFLRTYNSQSRHDANNDDGSGPDIYGNDWTNPFDARLVYNATTNVMTVYDIDGARYDYTSDGNGNWIPPAGVHTILQMGSNPCGYQWVKKNGTIYHFYAPFIVPTSVDPYCKTTAGYDGLMWQITGRDHNNYVQMTYSWANDDSSTLENVTQILASNADGQSMTLNFGLVNGTGPNELASITRPDGQTIDYSYDANGDLTEVDRPGNGTTTPIAADKLPETYSYAAGRMLNACSPREVVAYLATGGNPQDGDCAFFATNAAGQATEVYDDGIVNFTPSDGTNTVLQASEPSGRNVWRAVTFSGFYPDGGTTQMSDWSGHTRKYVYDAQGRVTSTQAWTGTQWLVTGAQWDSHDNLIATSDARGNETDYAYDANGNTVAVAKPMVANAQGSFRPTTLISYDANNNIVAYCDPNHTHAVGDDWIGSDPGRPYSTGDSLCASELGATRYTWDTSDTEDNDGKLETATTPMGYTVTYTYDNYAMPLTVTGAPITQLNGTAITPTQAFTYTPTGMLASYNKGGGTWALTYDALNRQTSIVDPDPGNPTSCTWYNPDGSVADTVGPNQQAMKAGSGQCSPLGSPGPYASSKTYDADGDVLTSTDYAGSANEAATTQNWYDAG